MPQRLLLHYSPHGRGAPALVHAFDREAGFDVVEVRGGEEIAVRVSRAYPGALVVDASPPGDGALTLCRHVKGEAFTSVVPVVMSLAPGENGDEAAAAALEAGADEVLHGSL